VAGSVNGFFRPFIKYWQTIVVYCCFPSSMPCRSNWLPLLCRVCTTRRCCLSSLLSCFVGCYCRCCCQCSSFTWCCRLLLGRRCRSFTRCRHWWLLLLGRCCRSFAKPLWISFVRSFFTHRYCSSRNAGFFSYLDRWWCRDNNKWLAVRGRRGQNMLLLFFIVTSR
jgi:hypothetical protein